MSGVQARFTLRQGSFALEADFSAPARGITALFGPSGAGKSTLLRCIAGLEQAEGYLRLNEETWQDSAAGVNLPPHRRAVGYVFQEASLFAHRSVRGNLEYGMKRVPPARRRVAWDEAVQWLGVDDLLTRNPVHLSGGERQRVAIARALLTSPSLLLLDEPLAALDESSKQEILPYLERLHGELDMPVIYVSHAYREVARLADHMVVLGGGRVQAQGPLLQTLNRFDLPELVNEERATVIEAVIAAHDEHYQLTQLHFDGGALWVARLHLPLGRSVRALIPSADVSLTLQRESGTSILNILPASVAAVTEAGPSQLLVQLKLGESGAGLLARITRKSGDHLGLQPGLLVYAQIKSVGLTRAQR